MHDIVTYEERISGMVIELHDVDIHRKEIEKFINQLTVFVPYLQIVSALLIAILSFLNYEKYSFILFCILASLI